MIQDGEAVDENLAIGQRQHGHSPERTVLSQLGRLRKGRQGQVLERQPEQMSEIPTRLT
jgi:hypothetical protein